MHVACPYWIHFFLKKNPSLVHDDAPRELILRENTINSYGNIKQNHACFVHQG